MNPPVSVVNLGNSASAKHSGFLLMPVDSQNRFSARPWLGRDEARALTSSRPVSEFLFGSLRCCVGGGGRPRAFVRASIVIHNGIDLKIS